MKPAYIIAAYRTPVAPEGGAFADISLHDLAAPVLQACIDHCPIPPEDVILANALYGGGNPARLAALAAGLPETIAGLSIDRQCAGGLDAILLGARMVQSGAARAVLAGGAESHSMRPIRARKSPNGPEPYDRPPFTPWPNRDPDLHDSAAQLAQTLGITRDEQDAFAIESHAKARAFDLSREIVPTAGLTTDAFTRNLTTKTTARATPITGMLTAANTAIKADAAAFVLIVDAETAARCTGANPAEVVGGITLGAAPETPATAPVAAIKHTLQSANLTPNDLSTSEIMEAYAVQAIACQRGAQLDPATMNRGGGALARGHPIGASGAINAVRLFYELQNGGTGIAAIAAAGGIGSALLLRV
ncbi:thiolase family protein [Amylibacter sp. IMCC11727]|uniref:thiolase family protein n=1 Tax=Amylibacter sp. IMCC11727 TaxID=3039851 RepID=UPI00244DF702|nr:thiolase family protein [Amylibacter sp. IMCC11727]WGI23017.1 thiolase family protein [Amylibacter sp. IMCC11727]